MQKWVDLGGTLHAWLWIVAIVTFFVPFIVVVDAGVNLRQIGMWSARAAIALWIGGWIMLAVDSLPKSSRIRTCSRRTTG